MTPLLFLEQSWSYSTISRHHFNPATTSISNLISITATKIRFLHCQIPTMSTLRLHTTLLFSFFAAQALSLPYLDPRCLSSHDVQASEPQSTTSITTTILTLLSSVRTTVEVEDGVGQELDHEDPTVEMSAPKSQGLSQRFRARRGNSSDSDNTLISTSNSPVATDATENQEEANHIKRSSTTEARSPCAYQDYECSNQPRAVAAGSGTTRVVEGNVIVDKPIYTAPPAEYVEHPPPTGHK